LLVAFYLFRLPLTLLTLSISNRRSPDSRQGEH
jgi:hypothetical protein